MAEWLTLMWGFEGFLKTFSTKRWAMKVEAAN